MLHVPALACLVPDGVFDAFAWAASDVLELWTPDTGLVCEGRIAAENPPGFAFVFRGAFHELPAEPGEWHLPGLLAPGQQVLAPYAIDDATDGLYAQHLLPKELFFLAATRLDALYWGLHDWCHFHNHGPFEQRAWTELQCDHAAMAWLALNAEQLRLRDEQLDELRRDVRALQQQRFEEEGVPGDGWRSLLV